MRKIIHKVRQQPESVRKNILHLLTIVFGVILVILWTYSLGTNLANPDTQARMQEDLEPLSAAKDRMIEGYESLDESY